MPKVPCFRKEEKKNQACFKTKVYKTSASVLQIVKWLYCILTHVNKLHKALMESNFLRKINEFPSGRKQSRNTFVHKDCSLFTIDSMKDFGIKTINPFEILNYGNKAV